MKISFLGQGFECTSADAIGNYLIKYFHQQDFHSFTGISAFASEAGIFGLSGHIHAAKEFFKSRTLIVGIDQEGTSKEALEEILNLNIDSFIFYQKESPIFHPKIYLFEGDKETKLIIGSSNLTARGLFTNVESSLLIEFDINDEDGKTLLINLKSYYKTLFDFSDNNLFKITQAVIDDFNLNGIVPDEIARRKIYSTKKSDALDSAIPRAKTVTIPKRGTAKIPNNFPVKTKLTAGAAFASIIRVDAQTETQTPVISPLPPPVSKPGILVWQKLKLSQSDAQFVPSGTLGTGNLKLSQAGFRLNGKLINQNNYFRNHVFNNFNWARTKPSSATYEETICNFDVTILGVSHGIQPLKLSYDPIRISNQANTPSWLHWGNVLMNILQQTNLTGHTLNIYLLGNQSFSIEII